MELVRTATSRLWHNPCGADKWSSERRQRLSGVLAEILEMLLDIAVFAEQTWSTWLWLQISWNYQKTGIQRFQDRRTWCSQNVLYITWTSVVGKEKRSAILQIWFKRLWTSYWGILLTSIASTVAILRKTQVKTTLIVMLWRRWCHIAAKPLSLDLTVTYSGGPCNAEHGL